MLLRPTRAPVVCVALLALSLARWRAHADAQHPASCVGYIGVMDAAAKSGDPLGPQTYINLADSMYRSMNKGASAHGLAPLPLPDDENAEARRAMVVVAECKQDMSLKYSEAVTFAYIGMRQSLGLAVALPAPPGGH